LDLAPVALFAYNRPRHTRQTVEALRANAGAGETDLRIYCDGPKDDQQASAVREVRDYVRRIAGFKSIDLVERDQNIGLARSIITGVTDVLEHNHAVIVVEDDLVTAPDFLAFMNAALTTYRARSDIFSVAGYNYPLSIPADYREDAYLCYRSTSWGWGTWPDRWRKVDWAVSDFDEFLHDKSARARFARGGRDLLPMLKMQMAGGLDSWAIRFNYTHFKHDALCLHPVRSRLRNIGWDGTGVHCGVSTEFDVELDDVPRPFTLPPDLRIDARMIRAFDKRFSPGFGPRAVKAARSLPRRVLRRVLRSLGARA
jgi:hypothetical protein